MKEEFVSYELALQLKELGFDEKCFDYYLPNGRAISEVLKGFPDAEKFNSKTNTLYKSGIISRPLWQQAFEWFRESYDLISFITPEGSIENRCYLYSIKDYKAFVGTFGQTYKEARQNCLENLINITKICKTENK